MVMRKIDLPGLFGTLQVVPEVHRPFVVLEELFLLVEFDQGGCNKFLFDKDNPYAHSDISMHSASVDDVAIQLCLPGYIQSLSLHA